MRYEELSLPIADHSIDIQFHPRLTVLAGLPGPARASVIDAIAAATTGSTPGASVTLVDGNNRKSIIGEASSAAGPAPPELGPINRVRNLLTVTAEDLGLPRPSDDPGQLALQRELIATRDHLEQLMRELAKAEKQRAHQERTATELEQVEATLATLGTDADRYAHSRARVLVELESVRATLSAVDATPTRISRDAALVESTVEIQRLAEQWAEISQKLDGLRTGFAPSDNLDSDQISGLVDIPETVPAALTRVVNDHDLLAAQCSRLKADLDHAMQEPEVSTPSDSRVMVLATLDQQSLWLTHRNVLLTTDALQVAEEREQELAMADPSERARVERAHQDVEDAVTSAEQRWLPGVLVATISASCAGTFAIAGLFTMAIPALLLVTVASLAYFVGRPRLRLGRARHAEATALASVDAQSLNEYLHRFTDDPESERWRQAERLIDDYKGCMEEWRNLVGNISPSDAGALESQVHDWISLNDPMHRDASGTAIRRRSERAKVDLAQMTTRLNPMLEPYGIIAGREPVAQMLSDRVRLGRMARRQIELDDTVEVEKKLTDGLTTQLEQLGFESGNLAGRISAYGRELDAAIVRQRLRVEVDDRDELATTIERLEAELAGSAPRESDREPVEEGPHITDLRRRRDHLRTQLASAETVDRGNLTRRRDSLESRIHTIETSLSSEADLLVQHPVDHLVETLIGHRPTWPTTDHESAPAILNDPFAALADPVQRRLLDALDEVAKVTQIILLTDDESVTQWAREGSRRGILTLVSPGG